MLSVGIETEVSAKDSLSLSNHMQTTCINRQMPLTLDSDQHQGVKYASHSCGRLMCFWLTLSQYMQVASSLPGAAVQSPHLIGRQQGLDVDQAQALIRKVEMSEATNQQLTLEVAACRASLDQQVLVSCACHCLVCILLALQHPLHEADGCAPARRTLDAHSSLSAHYLSSHACTAHYLSSHACILICCRRQCDGVTIGGYADDQDRAASQAAE